MKECTRVRRRIRWWQHFSSGTGSHLSAQQLSYHGRRANFDVGMRNVLIGKVDQCPEQWGVLLLPFLLKTHHTNPYGNYQWNLEYRVRPCLATYLLMKSSRPIFEKVLSDANMRRHEACAMLLEWFATALSRSKFLCSDEWVVYLSSLIRNAFFGPKRILITRFTCETTHTRVDMEKCYHKSYFYRNYQWCFIHWHALCCAIADQLGDHATRWHCSFSSFTLLWVCKWIPQRRIPRQVDCSRHCSTSLANVMVSTHSRLDYTWLQPVGIIKPKWQRVVRTPTLN